MHLPFIWVVLLAALAPPCIASSHPVVDLGYELHRAISFDVCPAQSLPCMSTN